MSDLADAMAAAFWAILSVAAGVLVTAFSLDANNPKQRPLFLAAAIFAVIAAACLVPMTFKWFRAKRRRTVSIECDPAFDTRVPSPRQGTVHFCRVCVTNSTGSIITNVRVSIVDLVPEHQGNRAFLLRDSITLADDESIMINIASHVEGVPDSAHLMTLQLPVSGGFLMSAEYRIVSGEQQFSIQCKREDAVLAQIRYRLRIDSINVMRLSKID